MESAQQFQLTTPQSTRKVVPRPNGPGHQRFLLTVTMLSRSSSPPSFLVSKFSSSDDIPDIDLIVLKRTIPTTARQSEYRVQKRVKSLMIELRVLSHDPIRKHENIIKFLGIAWEMDPDPS